MELATAADDAWLCRRGPLSAYGSWMGLKGAPLDLCHTLQGV